MKRFTASIAWSADTESFECQNVEHEHGEYVRRESAEKLYAELERCRAILVQEQLYTMATSVDAALKFADEN